MHKKLTILYLFPYFFLSLLSVGAAQTLMPGALNATHRIQVVAVSDDKPLEAAEAFAKDFSVKFDLRAYVIHKDRWYKVLLGDFADKAEMRSGLKLVKKNVKDAWPVAPDNDKIVAVWEKGSRVDFSQAGLIPTTTPEPKARAILEQPRVAAEPEKIETEALPLEKMIVEAEPKPETREENIELEVRRDAEAVATPTPLPGVLEEDLLAGPSKSTEIVVVDLSEASDVISPTAAPTVSLDLPEFSRQFEDLAAPPKKSEALELPSNAPNAGSGELLIDIDDLQLDDVLEDPQPAGELPFAVLAPEQSMLLTRSQESVLLLWELEERKQIAALVGHRYPIVSAGFSPDAQHIVSAARFDPNPDMGELRLWDSSTGRELEYFYKELAPIGEVGFSQDGSYIYHYNGEWRWWDLATGEELLENAPGPEDMYESVRLRQVPSRQTSLILKGSTLWDTEQKQEILSLSVRRAAPVQIKISSDDKRLVAVGFADGTLDLWDLEARELRFRKSSHSGRICDLSFSFKKQHLASVSADGSFKVWTLKDGTEQQSLVLDFQDIRDVKFDHVNTRILVLHQNSLTAFDPSSRQQHRIFPAGEYLVSGEKQMGERDRLVCPPNADAALAFDLDCCSPVLFQQLAGGSEIGLPELFGTPLSSAAFSPTGHFFVIGRGRLVDFVPGKARVEVYQFLPSGKKQAFSVEFLLAAQAGLFHDVTSLAFSPKSSVLLAGHENGVLQLFPLFSKIPSGKDAPPEPAARAGKVLRNFEGHFAGITGLAFFADGKRFVSVSDDGTLRVWDVKSGKELERLDFE